MPRFPLLQNCGREFQGPKKTVLCTYFSQLTGRVILYAACIFSKAELFKVSSFDIQRTPAVRPYVPND